MELFPNDQAAGMFRSASSRDLEFHADLVLFYRAQQPREPLHGQFMLIELADAREALLGRITTIVAQGRLTSEAGEEYSLRAIAEQGSISENIRRRELRYRVDVRLLGVLRHSGNRLVFAPSQRRLPHVGARVAFPPAEILRAIAGGARGPHCAEIGFYALGEFVYCGDDARIERRSWMQPLHPAVPVRFAVRQLVAKRTFVFARAGFGKSNLIKLLLAGLYAERPTLALRDGRRAPVGTLVFDPDGEYFWPDARGRPALCDVRALREQLVVFTEREAPSPFYGSFKAGGVRLDLRRLPPSLVLGIALAPEQQGQQNVHKLKALDRATWSKLVDLIHDAGHHASREQIRALLGLKPSQDAELNAARANMTRVVQALHDAHSNTLPLLVRALAQGKLCVVDISMLRGAAGLMLSGIVLRYIFAHNQREFTKANPRPIPTIAVVEEAQAVLGASGSTADRLRPGGHGSGTAAYEEWVKEGRKYSLGTVLVTQQPSAIPSELLSQGDSWFVFHLLAQEDLRAVRAANAHFSDDLLALLLNEPLPGTCVFWSSVGDNAQAAGYAYPIPVRVLSFEQAHPTADPHGRRVAIDVYASRLRG